MNSRFVVRVEGETGGYIYETRSRYNIVREQKNATRYGERETAHQAAAVVGGRVVVLVPKSGPRGSERKESA